VKAFRLVVLVFSTSLFSATPLRADDTSWIDRIDFSGDFRLRFEGIYEQFEEDRDRFRFRARFGFAAEVSDEVTFIVRLASGGDNPVSTNQTFGDGFSSKDLSLDRAYVDWRPNESLSIHAGKIRNPLFRAGRTPLIWDNDLNPEGFALKLDSGMLFATLAGFSVEERSASDNSLLYAAQVGLNVTVGGAARLTTGIGYFTYTETVGNRPFYNGRARGNTVDADGNYVFDYGNTELFAELDTAVGDWPLQVFGHYTRNGEVSRQDTAYAFGARFGRANKPRRMEFTWMYENIEADALIGTFNDADFGGGGTDSTGHIFNARYSYNDGIFFSGTLFVNSVEQFQGVEHDYDRIQLDIEFRFN